MNNKQKSLLLSLIHLYGTKRVRCYSVNVQHNGPNETKENTEKARDKVFRDIEACLANIQESHRDEVNYYKQNLLEFTDFPNYGENDDELAGS